MLVTSKYDELRFKTDTELVQLINSELDFALTSIVQAVDQPASVGHLHAERVWVDASRLIRLIDGEENARLASRVEHVRKVLDFLYSPDPGEHDIETIARWFWHAKGCPEGSADEDWFLAERAMHGMMQVA